LSPALGTVARDHRRGLGLAIALEEGEAERLEEDADLGIERRAARDHRLHPPAEALGLILGSRCGLEDQVHRLVEDRHAAGRALRADRDGA
jgi:hypothetical protein